MKRVNQDKKLDKDQKLKKREIQRLFALLSSKIIKPVREEENLKTEGTKALVTDFALAHWLAQSY